MTPLLRIGTRGSPLALVQARYVAALLAFAAAELAGEGAIEIVPILTTGDTEYKRRLSEIGGKGLFTKEIEDALISGHIDLAVHSLKDVATNLPAGLVLAAFLERADPRDVLVARSVSCFGALPNGAVIGSSALRRQAQLLRARPDLRIVPMRGNVETRLDKVVNGVVDATLLALAGLRRLNLEKRVTEILPISLILPAPCQGTIAIEARESDERVRGFLAPLNQAATQACSLAERALLKALDGSCRTPIAALAEMEAEGTLVLRARLLSPDGSSFFEAVREGAAADAVRLGAEAGAELRALAGTDFFTWSPQEGQPV